MGALSNAVTLTTEADAIYTEKITGVLAANFPIPIVDQIVNLITINAGEASKVQVPLDPVTTIASGTTLTEAEDAPSVTGYDLDSDTITVTTKGLWQAATAEAVFHSTRDVMDGALQNSLQAIIDQRERVVLAEALNITANYDGSGLPFDLDAFGAAKSQFFAQNPIPGAKGYAMVLHADQARDWEEALRSTSAGMPVLVAGGMAGMGGLINPAFEGFAIYRSNNVIAATASDWAGVCCSAGDGGSMGLAVALLNGADIHARVTTPGSDRHVKLQSWVGVFSRYAAGILNQNNALRLTSQT